MKSIASLLIGVPWIAAVLIALIPVAIGFDYAGVFWWTQYVGSVAILAACSIALVSIPLSSPTPKSAYVILLPLAVWVTFAFCQGLSYPRWVVDTLSAGTHSAYVQWAGELFESRSIEQGIGPGSHIPLSISSFDSRHATAVFAILLPLSFASLTVFRFDNCVMALLIATSVGIAAHVAFDFWCQLAVDTANQQPPLNQARFGSSTIVNRNNAALHFNLGIAASLGILFSRLNSAASLQFDRRAFDLLHELRRFSSPIAIIAIIAAGITTAGILACGSRSGLLSLVGALTVAAMRLGGKLSVARAIAAVAILSATFWIVLSSDGADSTMGRLSELDLRSGEGLSDNARWAHWKDGAQASTAYFPAGSGLSTYGYAYLPFQSESEAFWFHHADNLYLELLVEQGVVGLAFACVLAAVLGRSLRRLYKSNNPADRALFFAATYSFTAVAISQFFDFGLVMPANLFLFVGFASAVYVRGLIVQSDTTNTNRERQINFHRRSLIFATGLGCLITGCIAARALHADAVTEFQITEAEFTFSREKHEKEKVGALASQLDTFSISHPCQRVFDLSAEISFQLARLEEIAQIENPTKETVLEAYEQTSYVNRRKEWIEKLADKVWTEEDVRDTNPSEPSNATNAYQQSLTNSFDSLLACPLGIQSRAFLVYLDFVHRDRELSVNALSQLVALQPTNAPQLLRIATLAVDGREYDVATNALRLALKASPRVTADAMDLIDRYPTLPIETIVPTEKTVSRLACGQILVYLDQDPDKASRYAKFLNGRLDRFDCESIDSMQERSYCYQTIARLYQHLRNRDQAIKAMENAVACWSVDYTIRIRLIELLMAAGRLERAAEVIEEGQTLFPNNPRFPSLRKKIDSDRQG